MTSSSMPAGRGQFLLDLLGQVPDPRKNGKQGRGKPRPQLVGDQPGPASSAGQQLRFDVDVRRDYSRFDRRRADLSNPVLVHARRHARGIGETRGWTPRVAGDVDRALVILLSSHTADGDSIDKVRFSELFPVLRRYGLSAERTIEVLADLDLFDNDRAASTAQPTHVAAGDSLLTDTPTTRNGASYAPTPKGTGASAAASPR